MFTKIFLCVHQCSPKKFAFTNVHQNFFVYHNVFVNILTECLASMHRPRAVGISPLCIAVRDKHESQVFTVISAACDTRPYLDICHATHHFLIALNFLVALF